LNPEALWNASKRQLEPMKPTVKKLEALCRNRAVIVGLILYLSGLGVLSQNKNFDLGGALIVLVLFGLIFPALAWFATIRAVPLSISVHPSAREMLVLAGCIIALSIYLIGGPQWIDILFRGHRFGANQILCHVGKEGDRVRCDSLRDLSLSVRLSGPRFRNLN